jgi:hypothetical protein
MVNRGCLQRIGLPESAGAARRGRPLAPRGRPMRPGCQTAFGTWERDSGKSNYGTRLLWRHRLC